MKKILNILLILILVSCNSAKSPNDLGSVKKLPPDTYIIQNTGSRHIVKCMNTKGQYYWLNDNHFNANGIPGYDAHQYRNPTKVIIR